MTSPLFLVTTGAESSGKTSLANALAATLHAPLVEECSRQYLTQRLAPNPGWHYLEEDLLGIALAQREAEALVPRTDARFIVCDTDLLVIRIWSEEKYGSVAPELAELIQESLKEPRLFLLCAPDMPWEPDPLRENPTDRWRLFKRYRALLDSLALPYLELKGSHEQRLQTVLSHISA